MQVDENTVTAMTLDTHANAGAGCYMQSIRTLLAPKPGSTFSSVKPKERIVIAVALAYAYLHLSDTAWWSRREVFPDFWFMNDGQSNTLQTTLPFLSFRIDERRSGNISTEGYINPQRPSLPAFGKLLLEIWKGTTLSWGEELDAAVAECELDPLGEYWLCAVNACLGTENVLKEDGSFHESTRMRSVFVLKVVKSLQWLFEKCVRLPVDSIFPAPAEPSIGGLSETEMQSHRGQMNASVQATLSVPKDVNLWSLHDGSGNWEPSEEKGLAFDAVMEFVSQANCCQERVRGCLA